MSAGNELLTDWASWLNAGPLSKQRSVRTARQLEAQGWEPWLRALFHKRLTAAFAPHQAEMWAWAWALARGVRPAPFIGIWPRDGGKSTNGELAVVSVGARDLRNYVLYACETQEQADDHVGNIASAMESRIFEEYYPLMADRAVGKFGNTRGWRRNRIHTRSGFIIDALGMDSATRGAKVDEHRPGMIVFDDLDGDQDGKPETARKIKILTRSLFLAGSPDLIVLGIQNLVHEDSIFSQLADDRADFLADRVVSGPHKAIDGLEVEQRRRKWYITAGTPTWAHLGVKECEEIIATVGLTAFLAEDQHELGEPEGGMFNHILPTLERIDWDQLPKAADGTSDLLYGVVWCDPAVTETDESDACGIVGDALGKDGAIYRVAAWEQRASPRKAIVRALTVADTMGRAGIHVMHVGFETDQGGDLWEDEYYAIAREMLRSGAILRIPPFTSAKGAQGYGSKVHRAGQMLAGYERAKFVHVKGTTHVLEAGMRRFPRKKPFDVVDCGTWSYYDLTGMLKDDKGKAPGLYVDAIVTIPLRVA